jgi:ABC-type transport system involved in cytochrome c biogenesis permease subunit
MVLGLGVCQVLAMGMKPRAVASLESVKDIAVLHDGRVKPLDTYARGVLLQFSGRSSFNRRPAYEWICKLLFAPEMTRGDHIFLINSPEIPMALGITPEKKRRYSYAQLEPGMPKIIELAKVAGEIEEKSRSVVEQEILRVYHNMAMYTEYSHVFSFAFPHPDFRIDDPNVVSRLGLPEGQNQFSFVDIALNAQPLREATKDLERGNPQQWSPEQAVYFRLLNSLYQWARSYSDLPFQILPTLDARDEAWLSPWSMVNMGLFDERVKKEVSWLRDMTVHYWNGDQLSFDISARALRASVAARLTGHELTSVKKIPLELFYNKADFFLWSKLFYGLAFFLFLCSLFSAGPVWRSMALGLVVAGFIPHALALIIRVILMARPPVTNLYETFIFVGFISVLLGIIIETFNKQWLGIVVASVCGLIFLLISAKFSAEGDTMRMLVAVLNSNFWLGTHVISITIGYAGCCVAGIVGHLYILQRIFKPENKSLHDATYRNLVVTLAFGLMMTFLGTMLGGIWADQSWGRFWGWDPKENGALLIVLWCAIIFHAKISRLVGPLGMAVAGAAGIIVVMWAWFGVNLLSIGLHSYGFTSGVATTLLIYVLCEIIFLAGSWSFIRYRKTG